jgi:hypothetical protein
MDGMKKHWQQLKQARVGVNSLMRYFGLFIWYTALKDAEVCHVSHNNCNIELLLYLNNDNVLSEHDC